MKKVFGHHGEGCDEELNDENGFPKFQICYLDPRDVFTEHSPYLKECRNSRRRFQSRLGSITIPKDPVGASPVFK